MNYRILLLWIGLVLGLNAVFMVLNQTSIVFGQMLFGFLLGIALYPLMKEVKE